MAAFDVDSSIGTARFEKAFVAVLPSITGYSTAKSFL
jgi:hypothetical protein